MGEPGKPAPDGGSTGGLSAGVVHIENPDPHRAPIWGTRWVMDGALEKRAAQNLVQVGDAPDEFVPDFDGAVVCTTRMP